MLRGSDALLDWGVRPHNQLERSLKRIEPDTSQVDRPAQTARRWRPSLQSLGRWAGTLLLGGYIVARADLSAVLELLGRVRLEWLGLALVLYALFRVLAALRWQLLLSAGGVKLPFPAVLSALLKGTFLGCALPATVGVDLIRAKLVTRRGGEYSRSLSSVIVERILGVVSLILAVALGVILLAPERAFGRIWPFLALAVVALTLIAGLILGLRSLPRSSVVAAGRLRRWMNAGIGWLEALRSRLGEYLEQKMVLSVVFGASLGLHYLLSVISWLLAASLAVGIPLLTILWVWPIVLLAVRLPISVLGFGVREVLLLELLGMVGLSAESAVSLGLLSGAFDLLVISLGGLLMLGPAQVSSAKLGSP